jgi:TonB-linked SusC/RagA family outer membrane protein
MKITIAQHQPKAMTLYRLHYESSRKMLLCLFALLGFVLPALAQNNIAVRGRVTNEKNQPVSNASVVVKGTANGTTTNETGDFQISSPSNATLVFSSVGYSTQEVAVKNQTAINLTLTSSSTDLEQVVVVGYGTQRRKDVTGSIASIRGEALREVPTANIIQALQGRVAGVDIARTGSTPGSGGQIRIRGNRSLSGSNDAFIVLDGIPFGGSVNDINTDDVASVEVLKDASSTAIYGSRGSNGVIIITTKRGRVGKPQISLNSYYGVTKIIGQYDLFTGPEFKRFKEIAQYGAGSGTFSLLEQAGIANGTSTNWQDYLYKDGSVTNHEISLSGGSEGVQYGLSGGYFKETGVMPLQSFERFSLRSTIDARISRRIKIGLNSLNTVGYTNGESINPLYSTLRISPLVSAFNTDGSIRKFPLEGTVDATATMHPSTLNGEQSIDKRRRFRTFNSLYAEFQILTGLKFRYNLGLDLRQENRGIYNGWGTIANPDRTSPAQANASIRNGEAYTVTSESILTYDKTIAGKHRIGVTGLFSTQQDRSNNTRLDGNSFPADQVQYYNFFLAQTIQTPNDGNDFGKSGLVSVMGRVNYSFDDRFLLTATFRRDGSSVFPVNKYLNYPAFAVGWNISNEKFMAGQNIFSNVKLRAGYGVTGNQGGIGDGARGGLASNRYNFGTVNSQGYFISSLPNVNLRWEDTKTTNIGLDFSLLNNRISGSVDVYKQNTDNLLVRKELPRSNGVNNFLTNAAATEGKGIEISLNTVNVRIKNGFTWSSDINFSLNREKIVRLEEPGKLQDVGNGWFVGQPVSVIYDYTKAGIWQVNEAAQAATFNRTPGQIKLADIGGGAGGKPDGRITDADRSIIGNFQPDWIGGFTNRFTYKNLDLSVVTFARWGGTLVATYLQGNNAATGYFAFGNGRSNQMDVDYWTPTNPTNAFPKPDGSTEAIQFGSVLGYYDATFVKVRSINLGYSFSPGLLTKSGLNSLRVYFTAQNPFIIYSPFVKAGLGFDPEGTGTGGALPSQGGVGSAPARAITIGLATPSTRQFIFGLNLRF